MPRLSILRSFPIIRSARVMQMEGIFDVPPTEKSEEKWELDFNLPEAWNIGLIVGPSGSGKTTLARELWPAFNTFDPLWWDDQSILDGFPSRMSIKDIVELLCSIGFSSPPSWLRPFKVLSTGEQFRVSCARAMTESNGFTVIDEFTSVVDRNVAKIASAAVAKTVRKRGQQLVAVSCHYDILDWLEPDWVFEPHINKMSWGRLWRRPLIKLDIFRTNKESWGLYRHHHYLSTSLNPSAVCFEAFWGSKPVAFSAWLPFFGKGVKHGRREHRTVCLPDYQGVGIGNAVSNLCSWYWRSHGNRVFSTTSHPAMIKTRWASPLWRMTRPPGITGKDSKRNVKHAVDRLSAGFEFIGRELPNASVKGLSGTKLQGNRGEVQLLDGQV